MIQRRILWLAILVILLGAASLSYRLTTSANRPVVINQTAVPPLPAMNPDTVARGEILYAQYCAKCHGASLEGAVDWKKSLPDGSLPPPPHDGSGHTWHHTDELLISITQNGGDPSYNSKMPAFKDKLTQDESIAILDFIKSKWYIEEREYQWWMTVRPDAQ